MMGGVILVRERVLGHERREREIVIFEKFQNWVGPQAIYRKCSSIDRGGIKLLSRTKAR